MRLLHVVPTYLPARRYGGPIVAVHGLCKALVARGHEVDVMTTNVDGSGVSDVPLDKPVLLDGVRVHYFASPLRRLYWSPAMRAALEQHAGNYDVVHAHSIYLWPTFAAARSASHHDVPYVISPRGMLVPELIRRRNRALKTTWLRLVERRNFAGAAAIHFTSQLEWDDARKTNLPLPGPFVVANGTELPPPPTAERESNLVVSIGRISWKKGLDRLIEAAALLPDVRVVIAGNDEEELVPKLRELAAQRGVADRVTFTGAINEQEREALLARAVVFALPSHSENFGNVVIEAMAMETPVVVTPAVGLASDVEASGAGIVTNDLAPALAKLFADAELRRAMGTRGRALVAARFAWPRIAEQMEAAYRTMVK